MRWLGSRCHSQVLDRMGVESFCSRLLLLVNIRIVRRPAKKASAGGQTSLPRIAARGLRKLQDRRLGWGWHHRPPQTSWNGLLGRPNAISRIRIICKLLKSVATATKHDVRLALHASAMKRQQAGLPRPPGQSTEQWSPATDLRDLLNTLREQRPLGDVRSRGPRC